MKKLFTLAVLVLFIPDILNAQNVLLSQDFSSSSNVNDYVGSGPGQLGWGFTFPDGDVFSGLMATNIVDQKLQIDLRSSNSEYQVLPARAGFGYGVGSSKLVKCQFKLNYDQIINGPSPKPAVLWINNEAMLFFGRDNVTEYFVSDFNGTYYLSGGYFGAPWYSGQGGNKYTGEHLITVVINFTNGNLLYNSKIIPAYSMQLLVDGIFQKETGWASGRGGYRDPILSLIIQTPHYTGNSTPNGVLREQTFLPTHRITFDDILIEDLTAALPVKLVDFAVSSEKGSALLQWRTAEEVNSDRFEIEHSMNAKDWKVLDQVTSTGGTKELVRYQYIHTNLPAGINYYRLKMVDKDETFAYSTIRSVLNKEENNLAVFPNPVTDRLFIESNYLNKITSVQISDMQGKQVIAPTNNIKNGIVISSLSPGFYIVLIQQEDGSKNRKRFFVQK